MIRKCVDLTGFGSSYERTTQKLFWYAVLKISKNDFDTLKSKLHAYVVENNLDVTGAMFTTALNHAWHFLNDGEKSYYAGFGENRIYYLDIDEGFFNV